MPHVHGLLQVLLFAAATSGGSTSGEPPSQDAPSREVRAIEAWTRSAGSPGDARAGTRRKIALGALPLQTFERTDPQYERKLTFRGFALKSLLDRATPPAKADLALLHTANGMTIPVPFRDAVAMKRMDVMIAREVVIDGKPAPLPGVPRRTGTFAHVPGIEFQGHKLSVAEPWHPMLSDKVAAEEFSPWRHADTLVAIEFVVARPYYAQFDVADGDDARAGMQIYKETCQFCHGARRVGAKYGWDFVEPLPLASWRTTAQSLYWHVAFRRFDAAERNLTMPALKHMTESDAAHVFRWMQELGRKPMRPYAP